MNSAVSSKPSGPSSVISAKIADWLFRPRSVALIGVSDDLSKAASRPLAFLRQSGFAGSVYPINSKRATVQGERAWPSVASLPEIPDHVYVLAPTQVVVRVVEECAEVGVPLATVLASGFSEAGSEGLARECRLRDIVRSSGIRLVGPSSLGVVNLHNGLMLTANAVFQETGLPAGRTLGLSHSGSMIGGLITRGKVRGIGFAGFVSVGSELDLSIGEIGEATIDNAEVDSYLLFLEAITHADEMRSFARAAAARNKPILAYVLGRSEAGAELAQSHTGALTSKSDVTAAFLSDCGIAHVEFLDTLLEGVELARNTPIGRKQLSVGVVTTTGGGAAMVVDQLGVRELIVTPPSPSTLAKLANAGVEVTAARIVDLTLAGTKYETMKAALEVLVVAPEFDLVVVVVGSSARFGPEIAVRPIVEIAQTAARLAVFIVPDAHKAMRLLTEGGVPCFRTPEACADAVTSLVRRRPPQDLIRVSVSARNNESDLRALDEIGDLRGPGRTRHSQSGDG